MKSTRRSAAVGAIATTVLLFAATACSSGSSEPVAESSADVAVETIVGDALPEPATDAPSESTVTAEATDEPAPDASDPTPADPGVVVPEALQFTAPLVGGGTFDGAAVTDKPTVFWFWAPT